MSEAKHRPTAAQQTVTPTVTTDPGRSRWGWSKVPSHLGPARTSTVVLGVLFLAIGALYLNIRPDTTGTVTPSPSSDVQQPTTPTTTAPTTSAPETTTAPETTAEPVPTESTEPTGTDLPTDTTAPTDTAEPTASLPTVTPPTAPDTSASSPTP